MCSLCSKRPYKHKLHNIESQEYMAVAWMYSLNLLYGNEIKTETMFFTLIITDENLPSSVEMFGIILDNKLNW